MSDQPQDLEPAHRPAPRLPEELFQPSDDPPEGSVREGPFRRSLLGEGPVGGVRPSQAEIDRAYSEILELFEDDEDVETAGDNLIDLGGDDASSETEVPTLPPALGRRSTAEAAGETTRYGKSGSERSGEATLRGLLGSVLGIGKGGPKGDAGGEEEEVASIRPPSFVAGADLSKPSLFERWRLRKLSAQEVKQGPQEGGSFARLLTPLSGPALLELQREVAAPEVVWVRWERIERERSRQRGTALFLSILIMLTFMLISGRDYLETITQTKVPGWLSVQIEHAPPAITDVVSAAQLTTAAEALVVVLGLLVPFLSISIIADALFQLFWARNQGSANALFRACFSGFFAFVTLFLISQGLPYEAGIAFAAWALLLGSTEAMAKAMSRKARRR